MIVIPMAGMSSRFFKAGYEKPKYMLEAHGMSLFEHSVLSFKKYFFTEKFLFIVRDKFGTVGFVEKLVNKLGIVDFHISVLTNNTRGQAETVTKGLELQAKDGFVDDSESITIFNIDTFRPNFEYPDLECMGNGYLEVFRGTGDNWSFAKPKKNTSTEVALTTEKKPISDLCSTGLYYFSKRKEYIDAYYEYLSLPESEWEMGELYIAPLYNIMIKNGLNVHYNLICRNDVVFCGIPDEYLLLLEQEKIY